MDIIDSRLLYFQHYLEGILQKKDVFSDQRG